MAEGESGSLFSHFSEEEPIRLEPLEALFQQQLLGLASIEKYWSPYQMRRKRINAPHSYKTPVMVSVMKTNIPELLLRCGTKYKYPAALGQTWEEFFCVNKIPLPQHVEGIRVGNVSDGQYKTKLNNTILEHVNQYQRASLRNLKIQVAYLNPAQLIHERIVEDLDRRRLLGGDPDVWNRVDRSTSITPGRANSLSSVEDGRRRQVHLERNSVNDEEMGMDLSWTTSPVSPPEAFRDRERSSPESEPLDLSSNSSVTLFTRVKGGRNQNLN